MNSLRISLGNIDPASGNQPTWEQLANKAEFNPRKLAALCNVSLRTLQRHFTAHYKSSPGEWLRAYRMNAARERVCSGEPIKAVAYDLGFKQLSHFSKVFKDVFGVPPSAFVNRRRSRLSPRRILAPPRRSRPVLAGEHHNAFGHIA